MRLANAQASLGIRSALPGGGGLLQLFLLSNVKTGLLVSLACLKNEFTEGKTIPTEDCCRFGNFGVIFISQFFHFRILLEFI